MTARTILLAFVLALVLAGRAGGTPQPGTESGGLDLVVLVDRSGSMRGSEEIRDLLVSYTLELVAGSARSRQVTHRLGLVSFGSAARIDLPLSEVRRGDIPRLRRTIAAIPSADYLGDTDFLTAFRAAASMLGPPRADVARRRAVLLITDGVPSVAARGRTEHDRALRRFTAIHFPYPDTSIDIVVPQAHRADGWERYRPLWRDISHGRACELPADRSEMLAGLHQIVTGLLGSPTSGSSPEVLAGGEVVETLLLPPYLESVVLDILGDQREGTVAVFAPDAPGRPLTPGSAGVEEIRLGQILRTLIVPRPAPGRWIFRKSRPDIRVKVLSQHFFPRGVLLEPAGEEPLRQYDRIAVAYRVVNEDGSPLEEIPDYPLSAEVSLVQPKGHRIPLAMERRPELGPGVFRTQKRTECNLPGRYWTEVAIVTRDVTGRRVNVLRDHWSGFSVRRTHRIDCRVLAPRPGERVAGWQLLSIPPVATHLECLDSEGRPALLETIVKGSPVRLFRPALFRGDDPAAVGLDLQYLGRGVFQGWLQGAGRPGSYRLRLAADREQLPAEHNIRFLPPEIHFARPLGGLFWVQLALLAGGLLPLLRRRRRRR